MENRKGDLWPEEELQTLVGIRIRMYVYTIVCSFVWSYGDLIGRSRLLVIF